MTQPSKRNGQVPLDDALERHRDALKDLFPLPPSRPKSRKASKAAGVALLLALAIGALAWLDPAYKRERFATAIGERRDVTLADGSQLLLDSGSQIEVSWHPLSRRVALRAGQVLFEVSPARYRRFVVSVGSTDIRVLGTRFNVRRLDDDVRVTLERGRVEVGTSALAVVASRVPVISRNIGIQMELPSATAARSCGLARPAITASTKPMAVVASCAIMIGAARVSSSLSSARMRKPRERGRAGLFTAVLVWAGEPRSLRVDGVVRKGQQGRAGCPAPHRATRRQTTPRCPLEARPRRANNRLAVIRRIPVTAADDMPWKRRTSPPDFSAASLRRPGIG